MVNLYFVSTQYHPFKLIIIMLLFYVRFVSITQLKLKIIKFHVIHWSARTKYEIRHKQKQNEKKNSLNRSFVNKYSNDKIKHEQPFTSTYTPALVEWIKIERKPNRKKVSLNNLVNCLMTCNQKLVKSKTKTQFTIYKKRERNEQIMLLKRKKWA